MDPPSFDLPISLPISSALNAEVMPASQYSYNIVQACSNVTDHADFSTSVQADIIHNVNPAPIYGLLHLDHHILLLLLIF